MSVRKSSKWPRRNSAACWMKIPKNASAWNYLGYMLADQGTRLAEAQGCIQKALEIDPDNYAYLDSLGWVYFRQNKLDEAENQLSHSVG